MLTITPTTIAPTGVTLGKATDVAPAPIEYAAGPGVSAWLLDRNDLDSLADWFALNTPARV